MSGPVIVCLYIEGKRKWAKHESGVAEAPSIKIYRTGKDRTSLPMCVANYYSVSYNEPGRR